jgi:outer membrane immunogenic protein
MKHRLLASAAIGALSVGSAGAADLPRRGPALKAAPMAVAPACARFHGFYIGGHGGSVLYNHRFKESSGFLHNIDSDLGASASDADITKWGWHGGVTGGYNWQARCTVFGVEADWSWANAKADKRFTLFDNSSEDVYVRSKMKWFGTVRARTGVVVDNLLLYVTGGFAYARFDRTLRVTDDSDTETFSSRDTRWGWTAGVGTEWAINNNWSLKSEVLYLGFTNKETSYLSTVIDSGESFRVDHQDSAWVSRIGVNYRF